MPDLPRFALSIRQPWAWAILNAGKDVENRDWSTRFRGPVCIHASKGMTKGEYQSFVDTCFVARRAMKSADYVHIPDFDELPRGGIIGTAEITGCVETSASPWFFGRYGFTLANVQRVYFIPCNGALGFFRWAVKPEGADDA